MNNFLKGLLIIAAPIYILASSLSMTSWNIYKAEKPGFNIFFQDQIIDSALLFLQEDIDTDLTYPEYGDKFFCPSFFDKKSNANTGVSIINNHSSLYDCNCIKSIPREPILNTPKMILSCKTKLNSKETLLINVHGINFVTIFEFQTHMNQLEDIIKSYSGSIILGGDFNTWNPERTRILKNITKNYKLTDVTPNSVYRKKFAGNYLDYVFIRNLAATNISIKNLPEASDHNPISMDILTFE